MKLFFLSAFIFVSGFLSAQSKKKIKELKIKSSTENVTLYKDGKATATYKSDYQVFDKDGNTILEMEYNQDGTVKRKETHQYVGENKTEEIVEHPSGGTDNGDDNGPPKKYKKTTWKYDSYGNKIEEDEYDAAGTLQGKKTYVYAPKGGHLLFEMEYDSKANLLKKTAYGYDDKDLKTEKKIYGPNDVLEKSITYTYTY
jgi:hypothetical protein